MFATIMSLLNMADGVRYAGGAALMEVRGKGRGRRRWRGAATHEVHTGILRLYTPPDTARCVRG